jgi:hypothetical protein
MAGLDAVPLSFEQLLLNNDLAPRDFQQEGGGAGTGGVVTARRVPTVDSACQTSSRWAVHLLSNGGGGGAMKQGRRTGAKWGSVAVGGAPPSSSRESGLRVEVTQACARAERAEGLVRELRAEKRELARELQEQRDRAVRAEHATQLHSDGQQQQHQPSASVSAAQRSSANDVEPAALRRVGVCEDCAALPWLQQVAPLPAGSGRGRLRELQSEVARLNQVLTEKSKHISRLQLQLAVVEVQQCSGNTSKA